MTPCVESTFYHRPNRYAQKHFNGQPWLHHRLVYALAHGLSRADIEGLVVMHICDNPPCVNVEHLALGTHADNVADREAKGRGRRPRGVDHGHAKLTESQVAEIRTRYTAGGVLQRVLAVEFGVKIVAVSNIVRRKTWTHLP